MNVKRYLVLVTRFNTEKWDYENAIVGSFYEKDLALLFRDTYNLAFTEKARVVSGGQIVK